MNFKILTFIFYFLMIISDFKTEGYNTIVHTQNVDFIQSLLSQNLTSSDVTIMPGSSGRNSAIHFQGAKRNLLIPGIGQIVKYVLNSNHFTIMANLQQETNNVGTLLAVYIGDQKIFELQSSGIRNVLRLYYAIGGNIYFHSFSSHLDDELWHKLMVLVSNTYVEIWIDCERRFQKDIVRPMRAIKFSGNSNGLGSLINLGSHSSGNLKLDTNQISSGDNSAVKIYFGHDEENNFSFKGYMQNVKIIEASSNHHIQCPSVDTNCVACSAMAKMSSIINEQNSVIANLRQDRLLDQQLSSCYYEGTRTEHGAKFEKPCNNCTCINGLHSCVRNECPQISCPPKGEIVEGECCPYCRRESCSTSFLVKRNMYSVDEIHKHGEYFIPVPCIKCVCIDGRYECTRRLESTCPILSCPESEQIVVDGECCKECRKSCRDSQTCYPNAYCVDFMLHHFRCFCKKGFQRDGENCEDIDECSKGQVGESMCNLCPNTKCINVIGDYECACKSGYHAKNPTEVCYDVNECEIGTHRCHEQAICSNTEGSYDCQCNEGYEGDGISCSAICSISCQNDGLCANPETCFCKPGFTGPYCEEDIDECNLGIHTCSETHKCVNLPGWYWCQPCASGFKLVLDNICQDINECELETHTCSSETECNNLLGSFTCECRDGSQSCSINKNCLLNDKEIENGRSWITGSSVCTECSCNNGVVTCDRVECNCLISYNLACCPQCDAISECRFNNKIYNHEQKWLHKCQNCDCTNGVVDCWPRECPSCISAIYVPGRCCPKCLDDLYCPISYYNTLSDSEINRPRPCHSQDQPQNRLVISETYKNLPCQIPYCNDDITGPSDKE